MSIDNESNVDTDDDSLLLLLRDAIVRHSPLTEIQKIVSCKYENVNRCIRRGLRPLHYAVFENNLECVRILIEEFGAFVNVLDEVGYSPIHLASKYGFIDIMHVLIDHGSIIDFHAAAKSDNIQISTQIMPHYDLLTEPLSLCLENGHIDCARLLIHAGANVNQHYFLGYEINVLPYENINSLELILRYGADPNGISRSGITPLIKACREGNLPAVVLLCRYGANVNYVTKKFRARNALITSIEMQRNDIVEQLLVYGGFINKHPELSSSPLEVAIRNDDFDMVRLLIAFGADVNEETNEDSKCTTPLILACQGFHLKNQCQIIQCLLENEASPNKFVREKTGRFHPQNVPWNTPLVTYIKTANKKQLNMRIVRLLLGYGARASFSQNPDNILQVIHPFQDHPSLIELLCDAADFFQRSSIAESTELEQTTKEKIFRRTTTANTLKNVLRKQIRERLLNSTQKQRIDLAVKNIGLPNFLQDYLLYQSA